MDDLLNDFVAEVTEQLDAVGAQLVSFESRPDDVRPLADVFRLAHSIKGTCGFLGLDRLGRLAHAAEALIMRLRDGAEPTPERVTLVLGAVDRLRSILDQIAAGGAEPPGDDSALIEALENGAAQETLASPPAAVRDSAIASRAQGPTSIRVGVSALERIMTLVSELVLTRNQLVEIARNRNDDALKAPILRLNALTGDLQDGVMRARMQPISRLFDSLPRLARELAHQLGKKIELRSDGANTELDRQIIDVIRDPLTHIVRNCADHGIETPEERIASGKPAAGSIRISASQEAGEIRIIVSDDGRGLDIGRIGQRACALDLTSPEQLAQMSNQDVCRFIFAPGFSTARRTTSISGRGIGLDVVRDSLESIGGSVAIATVLGRGTTFTLKIPLTLAIAPALIVECGGQKFALPQNCVVEVVGAAEEGRSPVDCVQGAYLLHWREQILPVLDLGSELALQRRAAPSDPVTVIMRVGSRSFGVLVDQVCEVQEIVVKPLAAILSRLTIFSGNTLLGDGSVVLILDPADLAHRLGMVAKADFSVAAEPEHLDGAAEPTRLLLFRTRDGGGLHAFPLSVIARIERVETSRIERSDEQFILRNGQHLMPLVIAGADRLSETGEQTVLVVGVGSQFMAIAVHEIIDIVAASPDIQVAAKSDMAIGSAIIGSDTVELLDIAYFMKLARPGAYSRGHARRFRILLVDDKQFFRDMLGPILAAEGYDVATAASAADALTLLRRAKPFDAIVTDIDMPVLDGYSLARTLAADARYADVPILALDAYAAPHVQAAALEAGMIGVVGKFDRKALLETLSQRLDGMAFSSNSVETRVAMETAA